MRGGLGPHRGQESQTMGADHRLSLSIAIYSAVKVPPTFVVRHNLSPLAISATSNFVCADTTQLSFEWSGVNTDDPEELYYSTKLN